MNKVSVVVPIYNVEKYLDRCILSIVNQSYSNLEILLVNDGSPDDSMRICKKYAKHDHRIKIIDKPNGGLSDARNAGLLAMSGDFVCFVDSDDYIDTCMIEKMLNQSICDDADVTICGYNTDFVDDAEVLQRRLSNDLKVDDISDMITHIGFAWNKLYKANYIKCNNFIFEKGLSVIEDVVFNEQVLTETNKVSYVRDALYHYIQRPRETLINRYQDNMVELHLRGFKARSKIIRSFDTTDTANKALAVSYFSSLTYSISNMYQYKNSLTRNERICRIRRLLDDETTERFLEHYEYNSLRSYVQGIMWKYKMYDLIDIVYKVRHR